MPKLVPPRRMRERAPGPSIYTTRFRLNFKAQPRGNTRCLLVENGKSDELRLTRGVNRDDPDGAHTQKKIKNRTCAPETSVGLVWSDALFC